MVYLSSSDVAAILVESTDYVLREVKTERLPCARRILRGAGRTAYRFTVDEVRAYLEAYDPTRVSALDARVPHGTITGTTRTA